MTCLSCMRRVLTLGIAAVAVGQAHATVSDSPDGWWTLRSVRMGPLLAHFVIIERPSVRDVEVYREAADRLCRDDEMCQVYFWDDPDRAAAGLPFTDDQAEALAANYVRNTNAGTQALRFACRILDDPRICFRK